MQSKGKEVLLLDDTLQTLDLTFLTNITGKLNHLNCELQGKDKTVADSAVTSSFGAPVQTSIMGPHFLVQNVQLGYFLQYRNHCVSLGFFDDSVL